MSHSTKPNPESTKFDRFRMAIGVLLAIGGAIALAFAGAMGFTSLPLIFAGTLFVLSGVFIAGSNKLAELISGMLG